jgi:hypothetical protein
LLSGTTSNLVRVITVMWFLRGYRGPGADPSFRRCRHRGVLRRLTVLDLAAGQGGEDLRNQFARGRRAQFHRDALAPSASLMKSMPSA